jgi:histidine phosphotransferase ChpT
MAELFTLSAPDLAALLCSRVCHDIISPVGAINNGLELLDEGGADEDAMKLIRQSARNASARLQFARIAFGAAGSAGMLIDTGDAESVAIAFLKNEKPELTWNGPRALLPKNKVKLLLNLLLVANAAIPRGGKLTVTLENLDTEPRFALASSGPMLRVPPKFLELSFRQQAGGADRRPFRAALLHAASGARGRNDHLDPRHGRRDRAVGCLKAASRTVQVLNPANISG